MSLNEVPKGGFFPQIELNQSWFKGKGTERIDGDSAGGTFFIPCGDDGYAVANREKARLNDAESIIQYR